MTNLVSILRSRDITLPIKFRLVQAMVFPMVMYECESWTVKKAECQRFDAFELWCWRRLLRVPWTARRSNQSILKEISPGVSLEEMMLKLKLQYFGHLMRRVDSLEKTLMLGGIDGTIYLNSAQETTIHMNITRWSIPKSDGLCSLQPKMEKFFTISKNKTRSWLWFKSWTPYCQIQT